MSEYVSREEEHFIAHFYVAEDIQKRGALDIKEYSLSLIHISEPTRPY